MTRMKMISRMAFLLGSALGLFCASANDIPNEFVVSMSDIYQGNDFQAREANIGERKRGQGANIDKILRPAILPAPPPCHGASRNPDASGLHRRPPHVPRL
jgi:hypothetical protein